MSYCTGLLRRVGSIALGMVSVTAAGRADLITFTINSTSPVDSSLSVLDEAIFSFDNSGNLTVQLENLTTNQKTDGQSISGLSFTISGAQGTSETLTSVSNYGSDSNFSNGHLINLGSNGVVSQDGVCDATCQGVWGPTTSVASDVATVNMGFFTPNGSQHFTITGVPSADSNYDNANSSMSKHNPEFQETVTFTLAGLSGFSLSDISNVSMNFGTQSGQTTSAGDGVATVTSTPEPGTFSLALAAAAFTTLGLLRRRRV